MRKPRLTSIALEALPWPLVNTIEGPAMTSRLQDIDLYLQRLGYERAPPPTLDGLRELQRRHTAEFPFETLATLLRMPVPIDLASLERKLLHEGRGGYCYE